MFESGNYPKLHDWYSVRKSGLQPARYDTVIESTAFSIAEAVFAATAKTRISIWHTTLDTFLNQSEFPRDDYQKLERFLSGMHFDLTQFNSELGYEAFQENMVRDFSGTINHLARKTNLVSFWFLSAWTALNTEDYESCLSICESVKEDFAPIFTIKGQALLESGFTQESIPAFERSLELDPGDLLTWFQLAKAEWTLNHPEEAWNALEQCLQKTGQHPEVLIFQAQIAVESESMGGKRVELLSRLKPFLDSLHGDSLYANFVTRLALVLGSKESTREIIEKISWAKVCEDLIKQKSLAPILKQLGKYGWYDLAQIVLTQVTENHDALLSKSPSDLNTG